MLNKFVNGKEMKYLKYKYKLDYTKINTKRLANVVAISNAFIISSTVTIVSYFDNYILQMLIGFFILIFLILFIYHIIGIIYKKKGDKKWYTLNL